MKILNSLLFASLSVISSFAAAQNFADGAKMVRYESLQDGSKSNVEYSYFYHDMEGETLQIKLLGPNRPNQLTGKVFAAVPHSPMAEDNAAEFRQMLKKLGISKVSLDSGCHFKGKAQLEIIELEEWANHYDADGNTAKIALDNIAIEKAPIYKCDHQGGLNQ